MARARPFVIGADSNVLLYLVGAEHPNERRVMELVPRRFGCARIWSYHRAFGAVPSIQRIQ